MKPIWIQDERMAQCSGIAYSSLVSEWACPYEYDPPSHTGRGQQRVRVTLGTSTWFEFNFIVTQEIMF